MNDLIPVEDGTSYERNKKRDVRNWYRGNDKYREERFELRNTNTRGDIPILHGDCDGKCICSFMIKRINCSALIILQKI